MRCYSNCSRVFCSLIFWNSRHNNTSKTVCFSSDNGLIPTPTFRTLYCYLFPGFTRSSTRFGFNFKTIVFILSSCSKLSTSLDTSSFPNRSVTEKRQNYWRSSLQLLRVETSCLATRISTRTSAQPTIVCFKISWQYRFRFQVSRFGVQKAYA